VVLSQKTRFQKRDDKIPRVRLMVNFFLNTIPAWQWALLALVPPAIIALYFLKLRRQPLEVPSTY
jgi:hypothetical protein